MEVVGAVGASSLGQLAHGVRPEQVTGMGWRGAGGLTGVGGWPAAGRGGRCPAVHRVELAPSVDFLTLL